ncbi:3259_t:CDS:2 [Paraglomus occultum]|uniref:3259_t:CDS:1 n=1 Tax=Paraglomus occultum TaxID=144539 RepID=A0A9N9FFL3_9GLOM|nr:3259_t:CDS:2 [Paraglomus occultum]
MTTTNLSGKVVLITGASAGIGAATALEFAKHGSNLISFILFQTKTWTTSKVCVRAVDVQNKKEIYSAINELPDEFKDIDILVNNAGLAIGFDPLEKNSENAVQQVIGTNVNGYIYTIQAVLPRMKERNSGDIINIGSISGVQTHQYGTALYAASKHAVEGLTASIRKELVATKIRAILIRPGAVRTDFTLKRVPERGPEFLDTYYAGYEPLVAQNIADCIIYAASRPTNVVISELTVLPNAQADITLVHREGAKGPV